MTKVYKYRGESFERDIKTAINNQIYISSKEKLNDPCEALFDDNHLRKYIHIVDNIKTPYKSGTQLYNELINEIRQSFGVYSLSFDIDNELLWSYYANGHKGFCIEYELEILRDLLIQDCYKNVIQVRYKNEPPILHFKFSDDINEVVYIMHGYKSKEWEHEREIRIIADKLELVDINRDAMTAIYFGIRMASLEKEIIINAFQDRNIKFYQMQLKPNSYLLEAKLLRSNIIQNLE